MIIRMIRDNFRDLESIVRRSSSFCSFLGCKVPARRNAGKVSYLFIGQYPMITPISYYFFDEFLTGEAGLVLAKKIDEY